MDRREIFTNIGGTAIMAGMALLGMSTAADLGLPKSVNPLFIGIGIVTSILIWITPPDYEE